MKSKEHTLAAMFSTIVVASHDLLIELREGDTSKVESSIQIRQIIFKRNVRQYLLSRFDSLRSRLFFASSRSSRSLVRWFRVCQSCESDKQQKERIRIQIGKGHSCYCACV